MDDRFRARMSKLSQPRSAIMSCNSPQIIPELPPAPAVEVKQCSGFGGNPAIFVPKVERVEAPQPPDGPSINQYWANDYVALNPDSDNLYGSFLKIGMVIGTYAAIPHIHMQLEAHRRFYGHIPLLVHDDNSPVADRIHELCNQYDCSFEVNTSRHTHFIGDLTVFIGGLKWAEARHLDILLKLSRRWIFVMDWSKSLHEIAMNSQYPTISNFCRHFRLPIRTECIALSVKKWADPVFYRPALDKISYQSVGVEDMIHKISLQIEGGCCNQAIRWRASQPMAPKGGYALWDIMGSDRVQYRGSNFLWHDSHRPNEYAALANAWGLPYSANDFANPNAPRR